jgi:hypothetical protein
MDDYKTDDKEGATHFGLPPLTGKWLVPGTHTSAEAREIVFAALCKYRTRKQQFAVIENIKHLPPDVLTRLRFDVDLHLDSSDPDALSPYVPRFVSAIYKQLYEYTSVDPLDECRIVVQKKPVPTKAKSDYKHGFKVTVLDVLASKQQMLQVRNLMYAFATWGDPTWLKAGMTLEELDVIDRRVYDSHGWLLYGSQKADQIAGGYTATNLWVRLDEEDSASLC